VWSVNVPAVPSPWATQDIGDFRLAGNVFHSGSTYTLVGSGEQIGGRADHFRFVHQIGSGDCTVTARVRSVRATDPTAKAGVMIRSTLNSGATSAAILVTPSSGVITQWRKEADRLPESQTISGAAAPYWVRMVRTGDVFSSYYSTDGTIWTLVDSIRIYNMGSGVYIGLAMSSEDSSTTGAAVFDNVSVTL
jgi:regulation of enolase protein 1 (concanavalin A-like superfamily)